MTRATLMTAIAAATLAFPTLASAQTTYQEDQRIADCERTDDDNQVVGGLLGAVIGGVVGNEVAGDTGAVIGGVGGAVAGAKIGDKDCENRVISERRYEQRYDNNAVRGEVIRYDRDGNRIYDAPREGQKRYYDERTGTYYYK